MYAKVDPEYVLLFNSSYKDKIFKGDDVKKDYLDLKGEVEQLTQAPKNAMYIQNLGNSLDGHLGAYVKKSVYYIHTAKNPRTALMAHIKDVLGENFLENGDYDALATTEQGDDFDLESLGMILDDLTKLGMYTAKNKEIFDKAKKIVEKSNNPAEKVARTILMNDSSLGVVERALTPQDNEDISIWKNQTEKLIDSASMSSKNKRVEMLSASGENINKYRFCLEQEPILFASVLENSKTYDAISGSSIAGDIAEKLYEDLVLEYKNETDDNSAHPADFLLWLKEHDDPKYSEDDLTNQNYSYYETFLTIGKEHKQNALTNNYNLGNLLNVNTQDLGDFKTKGMVHDDFYKFKGYKNGKLMNPHDKGIATAMVHQDPYTLIKFIQLSGASLSNRGSLGAPDGYTYLGSSEINYYIAELNRAFGYVNDNGDSWDWINLEANNFPDVDDMLEDYKNSEFLVN